jgi:hypothetical protein
VDLAAAFKEGKRSAYRDLVGKDKGKGPLGTPKQRWEYSIKIDLQEME